MSISEHIPDHIKRVSRSVCYTLWLHSFDDWDGLSLILPAHRDAPQRAALAYKSNRKSEGQYLPLPYAQLESAAWRSLSGAAVRLWLELHTRYNGGNK